VHGSFGHHTDCDTTECAESKECHGPKHHYDECVERVTGQIENDGKASEDCVEECTSLNCPRITTIIDIPSLPSRSLRDPMRCSQALCSAQVNISQPTTIACRTRCPPSRLDTDSTLLNSQDRDDISLVTVNTEVMFRITVLFPQCQAKSSRHIFRIASLFISVLSVMLHILIRLLVGLVIF
jgi:hypothetical protein